MQVKSVQIDSQKQIELKNVTLEPKQPQRIPCYMITKSDRVQRFELAVTQSELQVINVEKQKVKTQMCLGEVHAKKMTKRPRSQLASSGSEETKDESPERPEETSTQCWYPLKVTMKENRNRTIFFDSRRDRSATLCKILQAQGFKD